MPVNGAGWSGWCAQGAVRVLFWVLIRVFCLVVPVRLLFWSAPGSFSLHAPQNKLKNFGTALGRRSFGFPGMFHQSHVGSCFWFPANSVGRSGRTAQAQPTKRVVSSGSAMLKVWWLTSASCWVRESGCWSLLKSAVPSGVHAGECCFIWLVLPFARIFRVLSRGLLV